MVYFRRSMRKLTLSLRWIAVAGVIVFAAATWFAYHNFIALTMIPAGVTVGFLVYAISGRRQQPVDHTLSSLSVNDDRLPTVLTIGFVSDAEKWRCFADADVFASLSAYEGLPVASIEALSFELPVVLSDISAHRTLIAEYEATGACIRVEVRAIVDAIERLENSEADVSLPEWDEIAGEYLKLVS